MVLLVFGVYRPATPATPATRYPRNDMIDPLKDDRSRHPSLAALNSFIKKVDFQALVSKILGLTNAT